MSEKVVLTQKEIEAIEEAVAIEKGDKGQVLRFQAMTNCSWRNACSPLNDMSFEKVARALFLGYEAEKPKFQAGDKIIHCNEIFTLEEKHNLMDSKIYWSFKEAAGTIDENYLKKATAEEIFWLHYLGRDKVNDFQLGDLCVFEGGTLYTIVDQYTGMIKNDDWCTADQAIEWSGNGNFKGIYPAEAFKPFRKDEAK